MKASIFASRVNFTLCGCNHNVNLGMQRMCLVEYLRPKTHGAPIGINRVKICKDTLSLCVIVVPLQC